MKLAYFFAWLAGGGLVVLATYAFLGLLKVCEARHDAEHEEFWEFLLRPGGAPQIAEDPKPRAAAAAAGFASALQ